ncbi:unnamed protein product [Sphagnum jensenii]|uniref:MerR family transcriptional regulator n=1 Tax=Sphagnum jensenii TaxID=128206 RepID=A0ABP0V8Z3_9BRYO
MWEQRYAFITPLRTETNIRYYSDEQLKMMLNVALLHRHGHKISKIAEMGPEIIRQHVLQLIDDPAHTDGLLDGLIHAMVDFDEGRFEKSLNTAILKVGFAHTFEQIILPFLQRTGLLWTTGLINPMQEHFISNLIRRKLCVAIDQQHTTPDAKTRKFVLFLPEGEWHELMLLYTDYALRSRNHQVIYLGASVPLDDIFAMNNTFQPDYLVSFLTAPLPIISTQDFINKLSEANPGLSILIGGRQAADSAISLPHNVNFISSLGHLLETVNNSPTMKQSA